MFKTEMRNPNSTHIHKATTEEILQIIQEENINATMAVGKAIPEIVRACDIIVESMKIGGRLIYIGAGTSGRTGIVDAAECPPTFGVDSSRVVGIIAGGHECVFRASETEEDNIKAAIEDLKEAGLTKKDIIVGISAAGNADYVLSALDYAQSIDCNTIGLTCNEDSKLAQKAQISIVTDTGAEVITGSTRMKAGTAQKLVLNMLSTTAMIKMGYVYENLMINLNAKNKKLLVRMVNIVREILGCDKETAKRLLDENEGNIRKAIESVKGTL